MPDIPATVERVPAHTDTRANERIRERTKADVALYARANPVEIERRLAELNREWTSERVLEANAAALIVFGSLMTALRSRRWLLLTGIVGGFLLQHALQGWCPPLVVIRRMGFRTEHEVDAERAALLRLLSHPDEAEDPSALLQQGGWTT